MDQKTHILNFKKTNSLPYVIVLLFLAFIFTPSCKQENNFTKKEFNDMVDTLYVRQIAEFNMELDSLCDMQMDSLIQHNVDSIMEIRLERMEKLLEKK